MAAGAATRCGRLEAAAVVPISIQDLFTLGGVHAPDIGEAASPL